MGVRTGDHVAKASDYEQDGLKTPSDLLRYQALLLEEGRDRRLKRAREEEEQLRSELTAVEARRKGLEATDGDVARLRHAADVLDRLGLGGGADGESAPRPTCDKCGATKLRDAVGPGRRCPNCELWAFLFGDSP